MYIIVQYDVVPEVCTVTMSDRYIPVRQKEV